MPTVTPQASPATQEAWRILAGSHDTLRSILSALRWAPDAEQPSLARILRNELQRHQRLIHQFAQGDDDHPLKEAVRQGEALSMTEVGSARFHQACVALAAALDQHIASEGRPMRQTL